MTSPSASVISLGIVVPAEGSSSVVLATLEELRREEPRAKVILAAAGEDQAAGPSTDEVTAAALALETDFVAIVTPGVRLAPGALGTVIERLSESEGIDLLYGDAGEQDPVLGIRPIRVPDYFPERLRCQFYFGDLVVYRRELFAALGGLRSEAGAAADYDLALRASRRTDAIGHLAETLVLRPSRFKRALLDQTGLEDTRRVLEEHLAETGGGTVRSVDPRGTHGTVRDVVGEPLISIVIPSRGLWSTSEGRTYSFLVDAVESIVERSTWRSYEIVVVLDDIADPGVVDRLRTIAGDRLTLVWWSETFNFSSKVNLGALHSEGEYILLLNDDVSVITPDWLERLLALAQLPGAGMSGAMLYYEDDTIQHAGHTYHRGDASHIGMFVPRGVRGPSDGYLVEREVAGVTAACAMMPMSVFKEVGALSSLLPGAFNDVDLCMKVTWRGYKIYWTPHAELYHYESKTRDASVHANEVAVAWGRWAFRMHDTSYWPYPIDLVDTRWWE